MSKRNLYNVVYETFGEKCQKCPLQLFAQIHRSLWFKSISKLHHVLSREACDHVRVFFQFMNRVRDQFLRRLLIANKICFLYLRIAIVDSSRTFHMSRSRNCSHVVSLSPTLQTSARNEWAHMIEFVIPAYTPHQRQISSLSMNSIFRSHRTLSHWVWNNIIWFYVCGYMFLLKLKTSFFLLSPHSYSLPVPDSRFLAGKRNRKTTPTNSTREISCVARLWVLHVWQNTKYWRYISARSRSPDFAFSPCEWVEYAWRLTTTMSDGYRGNSEWEESGGKKAKKKTDLIRCDERKRKKWDSRRSGISRCREIYWFFFLSSWELEMWYDARRRKKSDERKFSWVSYFAERVDVRAELNPLILSSSAHAVQGRGRKNFIERSGDKLQRAEQVEESNMCSLHTPWNIFGYSQAFHISICATIKKSFKR